MPGDYSFHEERWNVATHGIGAALAMVGGFALVLLSAATGDLWLVAGVMVFAITMTLLYMASTLYHSARHPNLRARLKILDHAAIYLLIAGTYTPILLGPLRGPWGYGLFALIWTLAVAGVIFKLFFTGRFDRASTLLYLAMGWVVVIATKPILEVLTTTTLVWLVAGGLSYTAGTFFYLRQKMPFNHAVWHFFVLGGTICHAISIATIIGAQTPAA